MITRPTGVVVKATTVQVTVDLLVEQKQGLVDLAYENQVSLRAIIGEAIDEYIAKRRGVLTERQAKKLADIEQVQREEATRLGIPLERLLAKLAQGEQA